MLLGRFATLLRVACALFCVSATAAHADFVQWKQQFRSDALAQGISPAAVDAGLQGVEYVPAVIRLDRKQPEKKLTFFQYYDNMVTPQRIADMRDHYRRHRALLQEVERQYGVPAEVIVALWGIESNFGRNMGAYDLPSVLATLAYEGRRAELFRGELLASLRMIERGIPRARLTGSWAGAMGQTQFLPTSYLRYAVDHDRNGLADIWNSTEDALASIAHYLASEGWSRGQPCVRRVHVPAGVEAPRPWSSVERSVQEWLRLGVRPTDTRPLDPGQTVRLVVHDGAGHVGYFAYPNFSVVMKWNRSTFFATTVCRVAEQINPMEMGSNP